ncbi:MAG: hypothetical protein FJ146_04195 [Deltaproteobacteria bacterium]|nr:hypothetical protein [Deltaproteobacteria bacterium]
MRWLCITILFCWHQVAIASEDDEVKIEYSDPNESLQKTDGAEAEGFFAPPIEFLFRNPALQANLNAGVDAINNSVDTLMDSLFYSIMNNDTNLNYNDFIWYNFNYRRRLFTAPAGYFVVVDRFQTGPVYNRVLWNYHDVPVSLGINPATEAMQIYIRTDGMRIAKEQDMGFTRRLINNWLGLVPILATILPPSFNQNQLYDPLTEVETPFVLPTSVDKFYTMPVGSIRSYALTGGIRLSPNFGGLVDKPTLDALARMGGFVERIPYALFKRGEHRINVLRHSDHVAWVGVSDLSKMGQAIQPFVGQRYFMLRGLFAAEAWNHLWMWMGVPVNVLPLNVDFEQSLVKTFDQVYQYDLRNPAAQAAYEAAVLGDFLPSWQRFLDAKEKKLETGVLFHFSRTQDRYETLGTNGPNMAVFKTERERVLNSGEVEITDTEGKFHILEAFLNVNDRKWNILVGDDEIRSQQILEMKVKRVIEKNPSDDTEKISYVFDPGHSPYRITMTLSIQDKYVDTDNFFEYVDLLRYATAMPMADLPKFPRHDSGREAEWRRNGYLMAPLDQASYAHVPPTFLGRFGAEIAVSIQTSQIDHIVKADENSMWRALASAFDLNPDEWSNPSVRESLLFRTRWLRAVAAYPLKLFNWRWSDFDAIGEISAAVSRLQALRNLSTPMEKLAGFRALFDTDYPVQLGRGLMNLTELAKVPRKVTISAQPQGGATGGIKANYGLLNGKVYRAGPPFPSGDRYATARAALAKFYLNQPREATDRPHIQRIQVAMHQLPASVRSLAEPGESPNKTRSLEKRNKHVMVSLRVKKLILDGPLKVFVRVDEGGKLQLGKLTLVEKVIDLPPVEGYSFDSREKNFEFYLTGPLSPVADDRLNESVSDGDEFAVTIAVSKDGLVWSDERHFNFILKNGKLLPVE